jgi:hypothetical protein
MSVPGYEWEMETAGGAHECEGECELTGGVDAAAPGSLLATALAAVRAALAEAEWEGEFEAEGELNPVRKVYPDAALEHLAHSAMNAENEADAAESFLPLIPMVAAQLAPLAARALPRLAPKVLSAVSKVSPQLTRGVTRLAGSLYRNPRTRALLRVVPTIARRTIGNLARQVARGAPLTPRLAVRTLARQTADVLRSPSRCSCALRRSRTLDRVYHHAVAPQVAPISARRPVPEMRRRGYCCCACPYCGR